MGIHYHIWDRYFHVLIKFNLGGKNMKSINLKGISKPTLVRIVGLFVILSNQVSVSIFDFQLIPFGDEEIYESVSIILTIVMSIITTWKDTPVTVAGQKGHELTKDLKK